MRYVGPCPTLPSLPKGLQDWLQDELEIRGVPCPVIYSRYVLSLLSHEQLTTSDLLIESPSVPKKSSSPLPSLKRTKPNLLDNYIEEEDALVLLQHKCPQISIGRIKKILSGNLTEVISCEQAKRQAAVECLQSVAEDPGNVEGVIDELIQRLKDFKEEDKKKKICNESADVVESLVPIQHEKVSYPQTLCFGGLLGAWNRLKLPDLDLASCLRFLDEEEPFLSPAAVGTTMPECAQPGRETFEEQTRRYNAAFPALSAAEKPDVVLTPLNHNFMPFSLSSAQSGMSFTEPKNLPFSSSAPLPPRGGQENMTVAPIQLTPPAAPCVSPQPPGERSFPVPSTAPSSESHEKDEERFLAKFQQLHLLWGKVDCHKDLGYETQDDRPPQQSQAISSSSFMVNCAAGGRFSLSPGESQEQDAGGVWGSLLPAPTQEEVVALSPSGRWGWAPLPNTANVSKALEKERLAKEKSNDGFWMPPKEETMWRNQVDDSDAVKVGDPWGPPDAFAAGAGLVDGIPGLGDDCLVFPAGFEPSLSSDELSLNQLTSPSLEASQSPWVCSCADPPATSENLLTSSKTHFRPIQSEACGSTEAAAKYADGTFFDTQNDALDPPVRFRMEEKGILTRLPNSFDSTRSSPEKYMVYREERDKGPEEDLDDWVVVEDQEDAIKDEYRRPASPATTFLMDEDQQREPEEAQRTQQTSFQPKFKLRSSKLEKTCQTSTESVLDPSTGEELLVGSCTEKESLFGSLDMASSLEGLMMYPTWSVEEMEGEGFLSQDQEQVDQQLDALTAAAVDGMDVFSQLTAASTGDGGTPNMLPVEYIDGELYDAMFGAHSWGASSGSRAGFNRRTKHPSGIIPSKRACSFFLEGSCRRADCKFSHDPSSIVCETCPFRHGPPSPDSGGASRANSTSGSVGLQFLSNDGKRKHHFYHGNGGGGMGGYSRRSKGSRHSSGSGNRGSAQLGPTPPAVDKNGGTGSGSSSLKDLRHQHHRAFGLGHKTGLLRTRSHAGSHAQYKLNSERDFPSLSSSLPTASKAPSGNPNE
ncbi:unnamed protein product [Cyprideis torosa]|uniref:Uncharacterized protein n=1 Tax=Cyprideis torosa TaxID=163714 RepID=A0A7R8ZJ22_9CRUS|nr:unnamed protein product [Cyprideis torosa]CAG0885958.1 unnamed protein product [Cyprideis torosa]